MQKISIKKPFDPSMIEVEVKNTTIGVLVDMLKNNAIDLAPAFQRKKGIWTPGQQSRLIESILLDLPLPSFYFAVEERSKKWIVIDGLQRLNTLKLFAVDNSLELRDLDFLEKQYAKRKYADFEYFEKLAFSMLPVTINILKGTTPPEVKYVLFQRINSAGTPLSPQEMRNALNQGEASQLLKDIAASREFKQIMDSVSDMRMDEQEYILRFFAFYLYDYAPFKNDMNGFLASSMNSLNGLSAKESERLKKKFFHALGVCSALLGEDVFRKPSENGRRNPISKALFDSLMVSVASLAEEEVETVLQKREEFNVAYKQLFDEPDFQKRLSQGTGKYKSVAYRLSQTKGVLNQILGNK